MTYIYVYLWLSYAPDFFVKRTSLLASYPSIVVQSPSINVELEQAYGRARRPGLYAGPTLHWPNALAQFSFKSDKLHKNDFFKVGSVNFKP